MVQALASQADVPTMYILHLRIQDLKLVRDVELSFTRQGEPRKWTLLLGPNGYCKTAALQAIALAAAGPGRANQLAAGHLKSFPDLRKGKPQTRVTADFTFGEVHHSHRQYPGLAAPERPPRLRSIIEIKPGWDVYTGQSFYADRNGEPVASEAGPLQTARGLSLPYWFAGGYGVERSLPVPNGIAEPTDPIRGRLASLFGSGQIVGAGPGAGRDLGGHSGRGRQHPDPTG